MPPGQRSIIRLNPGATAVEHLSHDGRGLWTVLIGDIVLLAEYTTNEGPYVDGYSLIFVTLENGTVYFATASFYSDGMEEVIKQLSATWKTEIQFDLCNSTKWKSRIMWPPELAGQAYFEFREIQPKTTFERVRGSHSALNMNISHARRYATFLLSGNLARNPSRVTIGQCPSLLLAPSPTTV